MRVRAIGGTALLLSGLLACSQSNDFNLPPGTSSTTGAGGVGGNAAGSAGSAAGSGGSAGGTTGGSAGTPATGSGGGTGTGGGVGTGGGTGTGGASSVATGGSSGSGGSAGSGGEVAGTGGTGAPPVGDAGGGGNPPARVDAGVVRDSGAPAIVSDSGVPANAVVLFDGTSLSGWQLLQTGAAAPWRLVPANKAMEVVPYSGDIVSKEKFEDVFLHVEYMTPKLPPQADIQARGNSGIYLKSAYEMQVLETHDLAAADDQCGAIYKVKPPLSVACFDQLLWNTYEIEFKAPRYNTSNVKTANARFTRVTLNGVLVQNDTEVPGTTFAGQPEAPGPQPILLQDHHYSNTVQFRNIWAIRR